MFENIQWDNFEVTYNEFNIDRKKPLNEQLDELKEDMLQAEFGDYIIDIGYSSDFEEDGYFTVSLIKNKDWLDPFMQKRTKDLKQLEKIVQDFVYMV
ncbi:MAG: hypothetical protein K0R18_90 [Bacillales bacterium]|jgi:hypothetical protein|nr:hypothetical protein [Bacillales bacterium]